MPARPGLPLRQAPARDPGGDVCKGSLALPPRVGPRPAWPVAHPPGGQERQGPACPGQDCPSMGSLEDRP
eukprot:7639710-Pyramimonas_sp.AAC.1